MKTPYQLPSYFSSHLIPLLVIDARTLTIIEVNKAAQKAFGYSSTFLKAHSLDLLFINKKELKRIQLPLSKTKKLANCIVQVKNKTLVHYDVFLHPLHQKAKHYLLLEWHQKTSLLVPDKPLAASPTDHFFKEAIQNSSIVSIADSKGTITFANEKFITISGYSKAELIGKNHRIINSGHHPRKFWVDMWKSISKGKTWRAEVKNRAKDGSYYWVDTFIMPFVNEAGTITDYLSVRNDITQRKLKEEENNLITERLHESMHFGRMGLAELSVETNQLELSKELLSLLEEQDSVSRTIPLSDFLTKYVMAEDIPLIKTKIQEGLQAVTDAEKIVHVEFRITTAKGNLLFIDAQGTFRKNGKALGLLRDITKKRLAQQEALIKAQQVEMMLSGVTDGFFALDHDLNFILVNSVFSELANMPTQEMLGKNILVLFPFMEGTTLLNAYREALRTQKSNQLDEVNGLNEKQVFRIFIYPNPLGLFVNFHDISSIKKAEGELRNTIELFRRLSENVPGVIYNFHLTREGKEVFPFVSSGCQKLFEMSAETLMQDGTKFFEIVHPEDIAGLRTSIQRAFDTNESWTYECRIITKSGTTKWIAGYSNPYVERSGENYWYGYLQDITQQKLDQISIAESELKNRLIIENSGEGILFTQPDGTILSANPEACKIFRMTEKAICAGGRTALVAEEEETLKSKLKQRSETGVYQGEILMKRGDGSVFNADIISRLFTDPKGEVKASIMIRDITNRKRNEQALLQSKQELNESYTRLYTIIRSMEEGVLLVTKDRKIGLLNQKLIDLFSLSLSEKQIMGMDHPALVMHLKENFVSAFSFEARIEQLVSKRTLVTGEELYFNNGKVLERDYVPIEDGLGSHLWIYRDVTHKKLIENELRRSEERFRILYNQTPAMMYSIDQAGRIIRVSDFWLQKMGYTREEVIGKPSISFLSPASRQYAQEKVLPLFYENGQVSNIEYDYVTKDNKILHTLLSATSEIGADGSIEKSMAVVTDISDKKKLADEVEKLALIASRTSNAVILTDAEGKITWVNNGFERITEYNMQEVIGLRPGSFLQGPETDPLTISKIRSSLSKQEGFKVELLNYSKSGKKYWLDIEVQPLKSADGTLLGFMAVESDITNLKRAVEEMQKSEQALQTFMDHAPMVAFTKDLEGRYTFYNKMYRDFMKGKDLHAGYTDYDIFDKEFSDWCRARDKHIVQTGETLQFEHLVQGQTFLEFKFPLRDAMNSIFAVGGISLNITEKLEAQKKIAEKEERLRSITDNLNDGVLYQYVVNAEGGIDSFPYASSGVNELFEVTAEMLAKDPMLAFNMVHPDDLASMLQKGEISRRTMSSFEHEYRIQTPSGKIKWIQTRSNPRHLPDGKTVWDGLSINITKRKKLELALQASEAKLQSIFQTMISGVVVVDVNGEITYANQSAADILSLESEEIEHRYFASKDWKQIDENGDAYPPEKLPLAIALQEKKSVINIEHGILAPGESVKWLHVNAAPLFDYKGTLVGAVASFLDVTERKKAEQALQNVYDELNAVLNASTDSTFFLDPDFRIRSFNKSAAYGTKQVFNREIKIGDSILDFTPPAVATDLITNFKKALAGEAVTVEREIEFTSDFKYWNQIRYLPVRNKKDQIIGVSFNASNISARKQAEQELFQSKRYFESLVNSQSSFLIRTDLQGQYTFANKKFYDKFGLTPENILGVNALETILEVDHNKCLEVVAKCLQNPGQVFSVSLRKPNPFGSYYWTDWEYVALQDEEGKPIAIQCVGLDTTEQKQDKLELEKVNSRLLLATQSGEMGIWELYHQSNEIIWDNQQYQIFGVPEGQAIDYPFFNSLLHEEDRAHVNNELAKCLRENKNFDAVFRIKRKSDGVIRYIKGFGATEYDADGKPQRMVGVNYDVTEHELKNQLIKDSEERFRSMAENIPGAIFQYVLHPDGSDAVQYMSNGCYDLWEIEAEEAMQNAKPLWDMVHQEDVRAMFASVLESGKTLNQWHWQWRIITPSGKVKWLEARGTPKRQADASTMWYTVIFDVTSHRSAQQNLIESQSRLQAIFDNAINAIILADDKGNYLNGNPAAHNLLEYSPEEFVQLNVANVAIIESAKHDPFQEFLKEGRQAGTIDLRTKTGKIISTRYSAVSNILPGVHLSIMEDTTARVLAEKELVKSNRLYLVTSQINQMVVHARSKKEVFTRVCEIAIEFGEFRMAWIGLVNTETNLIEPLIWSGHEDHYFDAIPEISISDVPSGRGPTGRAARERRITANNNIADPDNTAYNLWREEALKRNYLSSIAIPIIIEERVIAILTLYKDEPNFFTEKEIHLLQEVSENISFAIQTIDAEHDRQQKAIALAESEQRFRTLIRDLTVGVLVQTLNTEIISSNQAGLDLLGLTEEQLLGMTSFDPRWNLILESGEPFPLEELPILTAIQSKKPVKGVVMGVNRPTVNDRIWLLVDAIPRFSENGEVINVITTLNNITELKEAEHVMQESRERIRVISDNLPSVAIYQYEEIESEKDTGRYIYFSSGIEGITGISVQELLDNPDLFDQRIHPEDREENARKVAEANSTLVVFDTEYRFQQKEGEWRWFRRRSQPTKMPDGRILWNGVIIDVTDQKMVELQLIDALKEKDLLIKEVHHRVKNNLQLISSIIYIKMASMDPSESRDFLDNMRQRIRSVALIHERLLQTGSINQVNVSDYLMRLVRDLQVSMAQQDKRIELKVDIQSTEINLDYAIHCGLIVNELVVNAYKHAFKSKSEGTITIQFKKDGNNCALIVSDDGVSLPQGIKPGLHGSFGMELLEIFIKQLKAEVIIDRNKGTKFEIDFKIES